MLLYHADCRHFSGEKPCAPHKSEGVVCRDCPRYDPVTERILIVKLDAAGDVLRTTCILPAFRRHFPKASLWWVTDPFSRPLLSGHPDLDVLLGWLQIVLRSCDRRGAVGRPAATFRMEHPRR